MSDDSSSLLEEERSLFRPFTRESLLRIEARIAEELEKQKELEKRRAEGEVSLFCKLYKFIVSLGKSSQCKRKR
jgi:hypothetical protein